MITNFILLSVIGVISKTERLKAKQLELSEAVRATIEKDGLFHITTKENAEKIIESGYLLPTKNAIHNHFSMSRYGDGFADFVYMFAGSPSAEMFSRNLPNNVFENGSIYAVRYKPDKFDINNFTERLEDGAITHEGLLDIANSNPELVRMRLEKGKLVEIPWDEPTNPNFLSSLKENPFINLVQSIPLALKELAGNIFFKDPEGKLKRSIAIRKAQKRMLAQYNNDANKKDFTIEKDGETYQLTSIGTKINDGKPLSGFRVVRNGTDFEKNVFMDAIDLTTISDEHLATFLSTHMNEQEIQSEYIGKPEIVDGELKQNIDEEYLHHFNAKQLRIVQNNPIYAKYVEEQNRKKNSQLNKLKKTFMAIPAKARTEALEFVQLAKSGKLQQYAKDMTINFIKDEK